MIALLVGLRGLSLVMIVVAALAGEGIMPAEFGSGFDQVGVMIFVVTAGFIHAIQWAHEHSGRFAIADYLQARAWRVVPGYYAVIVASLAISGWWDGWPYRFDSVTSVARALLLVDAPGALWIVPVYLQCCLLFLIPWWIWSRGWSVWWLAGVAALSTVPALVGLYPESGHAVSVVAPYFLTGVGIGLAWPGTLEPFVVRHLGAVSVLGGLSFILVCINAPAARATRGWTLGESVVATTWFDPLNALVVIVLVVATATRPIALAVLGTLPLLALGQYWYAGYLVTPVLIALLAALLPG